SAESLAIYETSLLVWFTASIGDRSDWQLAILAPPREHAPHSSLVHMFDTIRRKVNGPQSVFLGRCELDGAWSLDRERAWKIRHEKVSSGSPVLLLGTAFSFVHLLDFLAEQNLRIHLPQGSMAVETGGCKGRSRSLPKVELYACITKQLGIPGNNIISE